MKYNMLAKWGVVGEDRRTGKSTGIALMKIGEALHNPNKRIFIRDHYGTREADRILFKTVERLYHELGLKNFTFRLNDTSIKYSLYCEVEAPERILSDGRIKEKKCRASDVHDGWYYE